MTGIALSVIVICLDEAEFIADCLTALDGGAGRGVEIVVVDGGSTDGTLERVRAWTQAGRTPVSIVRSQPGYGRQRNAGVAAARGTFVAFLSADVRVAAGWTAEVLGLIAGGSDLLIGLFDLVPMPGRGRWMPALAPTLYPSLDPSLAGGAVERASAVHLALRRSTLRRTPFDESLGACEDKDLVFRLLRGEQAIAMGAVAGRPQHLAREGVPAYLRKLHGEAAALAAMSRRHGPGFPDCFGWRAHAMQSLGLLALAAAALLLDARPLAAILGAAFVVRAAFHGPGLARNPGALASPRVLALHAAAMATIILGTVAGLVGAGVTTRVQEGECRHGQDRAARQERAP